MFPAHGSSQSLGSLFTLGEPITFDCGPFAGHTLRAELQEIQKADLGRKYARKDRRPLDPPPVVLLKLFEVREAGTTREREKELDYEKVDCAGILCHVDLFPVPDYTGLIGHNPNVEYQSHPSQGSSQPASTIEMSPAVSAGSEFHSSSAMLSRSHDVRGSPQATSHSQSDAVYHFKDYPIVEDSKRTGALAGSTFVQTSCPEYEGRRSLVFVFADLAVKIEGTFILRYRAFDIMSKFCTQDTYPMIAECYGGTFKIYSTKDFPGLRASTDLTKRLSVFGVRLNLRENERKRRKAKESNRARNAITATEAQSPTPP